MYEKNLFIRQLFNIEKKIIRTVFYLPCKAACRFIRFGCYFGLKGQKNHKNQTFNSIQKLFSSFLPRISQVTIYKALVFSISVIVLMVTFFWYCTCRPYLPLLLLISSVRDSSAFIYLFWSIFLYNYCLQHNAMFFGKL